MVDQKAGKIAQIPVLWGVIPRSPRRPERARVAGDPGILRAEPVRQAERSGGADRVRPIVPRWVQAPTYVSVLEALRAWNPIPTPLAVSCISPDLNGDLIVNLLDIAAFAADFFSGVYAYRSDFNNDGVLNLADISHHPGFRRVLNPAS
jgi:hypothetical protein